MVQGRAHRRVPLPVLHLVICLSYLCAISVRAQPSLPGSIVDQVDQVEVSPPGLDLDPLVVRQDLEGFFNTLDRDRDGSIDAAEAEAFIEGSIGGSEFDEPREVAAGVQDFLHGLDGVDADGAMGATVSVDELDKHLHSVLTAVRVWDWVQHGLGLPQYADAFRQHSVSVLDFPMLIHDNGKVLEDELGVTNAFHRAKIVRAIRRQIMGLGSPPSAPRVVGCNVTLAHTRLAAHTEAPQGRPAVAAVLWWSPPPERGQPPLHKYVMERAAGDGTWHTVHQVDDPEPAPWTDELPLPLPPHVIAGMGGSGEGAAVTYRVSAWNLYGRSPYTMLGCELSATLLSAAGARGPTMFTPEAPDGAAALAADSLVLANARAHPGAARAAAFAAADSSGDSALPLDDMQLLHAVQQAEADKGPAAHPQRRRRAGSSSGSSTRSLDAAGSSEAGRGWLLAQVYSFVLMVGSLLVHLLPVSVWHRLGARLHGLTERVLALLSAGQERLTKGQAAGDGEPALSAFHQVQRSGLLDPLGSLASASALDSIASGRYPSGRTSATAAGGGSTGPASSYAPYGGALPVLGASTGLLEGAAQSANSPLRRPSEAGRSQHMGSRDALPAGVSLEPGGGGAGGSLHHNPSSPPLQVAGGSVHSGGARSPARWHEGPSGLGVRPRPQALAGGGAKESFYRCSSEGDVAGSAVPGTVHLAGGQRSSAAACVAGMRLEQGGLLARPLHAHHASADGRWPGSPDRMGVAAAAQAGYTGASGQQQAPSLSAKDRGRLCAFPNCGKVLRLELPSAKFKIQEYIKQYKEYTRRHYCWCCQHVVCLTHTAYSPHGETGDCGHESRCMCVTCFALLDETRRSEMQLSNRLQHPAPSSGQGSPLASSVASGTAAAAGVVAGTSSGAVGGRPPTAPVHGRLREGSSGAAAAAGPVVEACKSSSKVLWERAARKLKAVSRFRTVGAEHHAHVLQVQQPLPDRIVE